MISTIFDNLLEPVKKFHRLVDKFRLNLSIPPFWKFYETDVELLNLQQKLNDGCISPKIERPFRSIYVDILFSFL